MGSRSNDYPEMKHPSCTFHLMSGLVVVTLLSVGAARQEKPTTKPATTDPTTVLREAADRYASLRSYSDTGRVITRFYDLQGNLTQTSVRPFLTRFERDEQSDGARRYYFEFRDARLPNGAPNEDAKWEEFPERYVVWRSSPDEPFKSWWTIQPKVEVHQELISALAGATGVSGGSALTIPALLAPKAIDAQRALDLEAPKLIGTEVHEGRACHVISGKKMGDETVLWIDVEQKVLRKMTSKSTFDDFRTEDTVVYSPKLEPTFADNDFAFEPPK
jgi:hypothetical protein